MPTSGHTDYNLTFMPPHFMSPTLDHVKISNQEMLETSVTRCWNKK